MTEEPIYIGSTHRVDLDLTKLKAVDGTSSYVNAADSCDYSIKDLEGVELNTGTMAYVSTSNGRYTALIPYTGTEALVLDQRYDLFVTLVVDGLQLVKHKRVYGAYYE